MGCSLWGHKESDMIERLSTHIGIHFEFILEYGVRQDEIYFLFYKKMIIKLLGTISWKDLFPQTRNCLTTIRVLL